MLVELGNELRKAREEKGESLASVADPANISAAYLHKLERGVINSPSPRVLARLALVLEVSYLRLMELAGYLDEEQLARARSRESSPQPHPLARQQLTPEEWRAVGVFIKMLIAQRETEGASPTSSRSRKPARHKP
jgi:HTH-type transcriptional regulator, competence development regulator